MRNTLVLLGSGVGLLGVIISFPIAVAIRALWYERRYHLSPTEIPDIAQLVALVCGGVGLLAIILGVMLTIIKERTDSVYPTLMEKLLSFMIFSTVIFFGIATIARYFSEPAHPRFAEYIGSLVTLWILYTMDLMRKAKQSVESNT